MVFGFGFEAEDWSAEFGDTFKDEVSFDCGEGREVGAVPLSTADPDAFEPIFVPAALGADEPAKPDEADGRLEPDTANGEPDPAVVAKGFLTLLSREDTIA